MEKYFKTLLNGRIGRFSGVVWPEPGKWFEVEGELIPCIRGLHLCREKDLLRWLAPEIWEAEYEGECIEEKDKLVVRKARLVRRIKSWNIATARLFELDCAEHFLWRYEKRYPEDGRPRKAIETARRYIERYPEVENEELIRVTNEAWAVVKEFGIKKSHYYMAALAAARAAGDVLDREGIKTMIETWTLFWDNATRPIKGKAWRVEREWQIKRLMEYLYPEEVRNDLLSSLFGR